MISVTSCLQIKEKVSKVKSRSGRPSHDGTEKDEREGEQMRIWVKAVKRVGAAKERKRERLGGIHQVEEER